MGGALSYEIDPDGRGAGLAVGLFGVLAVVAAFGALRGAPGALVLFGASLVALVVLSRILARGGLVLDERGITDARADEETIPWPEVSALGIVEHPRGRDRKRAFLEVTRVDGERIELPIWNLEVRPEAVLERAGEVRRSYVKPAPLVR